MQGLSDERVRIMDLDVAPTPTIQFALGALKAHGAVAVTASHNPAQWNGFKFFLAPDNTVLDGAQTERLIRELAHSSDFAGAVTRDNQQERAVALHVARVLEQVDAESIRRRRFRVALDAARGAGERPALRLLDALGCAVTRVDVERESEPVAENLAALGAAVVQDGCAVGFAQDLDGGPPGAGDGDGDGAGRGVHARAGGGSSAAPRSPVGPGGGQERVDHARGG